LPAASLHAGYCVFCDALHPVAAALKFYYGPGKVGFAMLRFLLYFWIRKCLYFWQPPP